MNMPKTLDDFLVSTNQATLENSDRETIHLSGQKNICALLMVANDTQRILSASENIGGLFAANARRLIGKSLRMLNPELSAQIVKAKGICHEVLEFNVERNGIVYDVITHQHKDRRLVEFIPNTLPSPQVLRAKMRHCSKSCTEILNATDFGQALQIAADASRSITAFSRVNIYRFLPDWSGEILAESLDGSLPSYLGLHFPASDIPRQVREYMTIVPYRAIGDASNESIDVIADTEPRLDLTWSLTRSVPKMQTAYLRAMGSKATFVTSLMHQGKLWGLISAHNSKPGILPFDSWSLMQEIGTALMLKLGHEHRLEIAAKISSLRRIESRVTSALRGDSDLDAVIEQLIPILQEFLKADGFAFQYGTDLHVCGKTPPKDFIQDLITWAVSSNDQSDQFQSNSLHREWERAAMHKETACGVLVQPIIVHRVCQLIWFRGPITQKVRWAGQPEKVETENGVLGPRQSFETWIEEHNDQSLPWQESDLEAAKEIFTEFLDLLAAQLLLKEENASLRHFAASAVHDIKAPLRGISMALEIMHEENFDEQVVKETHLIAQRSARQLVDLSSGLLDLAAIPGQASDFEPTDLDALLREVCAMLNRQITEAGASVTTNVSFQVDANSRLLVRLFLNLIANALKFRRKEGTVQIDVSVMRATDTHLEIAVSDTGLGIEPRYAARIFEPLQRLHSNDQIDGSGLGLTICRRIAELHEGTLWLDESYQDGARFVVRLPRNHTKTLTGPQACLINSTA